MTAMLSRHRCTVLLLLFLLADSLNTDLSAAGPMGWLLCLPAALAALPVCRGAYRFNRWLRQQGSRWMHILWDGFLLTVAVTCLRRMTMDFAGILRTYNDFVRTPGLLCLLLLATALYLSRLKGEGLARTAELLFWPILAILAWTFLVGLGDSDFGRLLPLRGEGGPKGILYLLGRVFSQGVLAAVLLEERAEPAVLRTAFRDAMLLSGLTLGLFLAKDIAQVGWQTASRFTYPLYALAGLTRSGTGMHIEDLLICALLTARLIKGAMLFRLLGDLAGRWQRPCP